MGTLSGKVAWVTGAGSGMGLSGAQHLAAAGATVIMSGRRADVLEREADSIRKAGGKAEVETLDVSNAMSVQGVVQSILARHGKVDILVNSAGLNHPQRFWRNQTVASWDQVIRVNLDGTFYCTHAVLPSMRTRKDGLVINISSWAGKYTAAMAGAAYLWVAEQPAHVCINEITISPTWNRMYVGGADLKPQERNGVLQ